MTDDQKKRRRPTLVEEAPESQPERSMRLRGNEDMAPQADMDDQEDEIDDLAKKLLIDKDDFDEELIRQPNWTYVVRTKHALAISDRDAQKERLSQIEYKIRTRVTDELQKNNLKSGVKEVDAAFEADKEWIAERKIFVLRSGLVHRWEALLEAFKDRSFMLKSLGDSLVSQRWSDGSGQSVRDPHEAAMRERRRERERP